MQLSIDELDGLSEIVNIGVGRAAASLSELLGTRIELNVPAIRSIASSEKGSFTHEGVSIIQGFEGPVSGSAVLMFPSESGCKLAKLLGGYDDEDELPELELSGILSEVGNIVLNGVLGSLANIIEANLVYSVPDFFVDRSVAELVRTSRETDEDLGTSILIADTQFNVDSENITGSVVIGFSLGSIESVLQKLEQLGA